MIVTVAGYKGGVGKTTTAVHLAAYFVQDAPTLLIDGDPNRSASVWGRSGKLPFQVVDERLAARYAREFTHMVIDTQAHPTEADLRVLAQGCDLLLVPTTPDALGLDALLETVAVLNQLGASNFRIVITIVPPKPSRDGEEAVKMLSKGKLPVCKTLIRRFVAFQKAALSGTPVHAVDDPRAAEAWSDYVSLGKEIAG
jgi:chromosome partitioning protein